MHKVHDLITHRWSPVAFDSKPVESYELNLLFEAAKWAPSGNNSQPWRFIFATKGMAEYEDLFDLINADNQVWAKTAPLLVLGLAQVISTYKNRPNRLAFYGLGMAVGNLLIQASHMDLMVHQMGGYDKERAKTTLIIPPRYEPAAMMAIGYKGDRSQLPANVAAREDKVRSRMEVNEFLVRGKFEE